MDPIKRSTKAAIEAALSAYYGEVDEAARQNALPEHQKVFDEIVMESEDLQGVDDSRDKRGTGSRIRRRPGRECRIWSFMIWAAQERAISRVTQR